MRQPRARHTYASHFLQRRPDLSSDEADAAPSGLREVRVSGVMGGSEDHP